MTAFVFPGVTGLVYIDESGERCMDYSVYNLQKAGNSSRFIPVLNYDGNRKTIRYCSDDMVMKMTRG